MDPDRSLASGLRGCREGLQVGGLKGMPQCATLIQGQE